MRLHGGSRASRVLLIVAAGLVAVGGVVCFMLGHDPASRARPADRQKLIADRGKPKKAVEKKVLKPVKTVQDALDNLGELERPEIVKAEAPRPLPQFTPEEWDDLTNRIFKSGTEQVMSWLVTCEPGNMPMPIPRLTKEERETLVAVLISKNEILPMDSEHVAMAKAQVDAAKKEMMNFIKEGGDPDEFMRYYYDELNKAFEYRCMAVEQVESLVDEDPKFAYEVGRKINEKLAAEGIMALSLENMIPGIKESEQDNENFGNKEGKTDE